jgi:hypothetical protein
MSPEGMPEPNENDQRLPNRSATNFSASKIAYDRLNEASAS